MNEPKTPKFYIEFNSFANFGRMVEASIVLSPGWELSHTSDFLYDIKGSVRVLTLAFRPTIPEKGRRIFSLKLEETIPAKQSSEAKP